MVASRDPEHRSISATPGGASRLCGLGTVTTRDFGRWYSGSSRIGHGGHGLLGAALYLATASAARQLKQVPAKASRDRLRAAGKADEGGALCAAA